MRLFDWGPSPFCLKIRAILEYKQLAYERVTVLGPPLFELWRRGKIGKVPALEIDGELICDSTDIAHELERRFPAPAITPRAPRDRGLCHALETWADESLYWLGLYFQWVDPEGAPLVKRAFRGILGTAVLPIYERRIRGQIKGQGTSRKPHAHVISDLERELDAVEDLLDGGPFLLGDAPLLCDFAVAAQLVYVGRTPHGKRAFTQRPAIHAYLERMRALRRESIDSRGRAGEPAL
jgi:glutathione S-transferase